MANNRTEANSAVDSALVATLTLAGHKALLKDELNASYVFDKDVIASDTPGGGVVTVDFTSKDTATVTTATSLTVSFTMPVNGSVKHLVITKQAANVISFAGAIDSTKNVKGILSLTSICYRVSNKNGIIYVEGLTPDFPPFLNRAEVNIGTWNMLTTRSIFVNILGLNIDETKIRRIDVMIFSDAGDYVYPLDGYNYSSPNFSVHGGISLYRESTGNILLLRTDGGVFEGSSFSGAGNRGVMTIEYAD